MEPVGTLFDESDLPAPRRYRPGDGFTGDSPTENERSRLVEERVSDGAMLSIGFLASLSSLAATAVPAEERLEDPDVDTVESDEEDGWEGWPRRAWLAGAGSCCRPWGEGAETDLFSWRSCGVLLKAYGAMGAAAALYPVGAEFALCSLRGICDGRGCCWVEWVVVFL